jgi:hypothetical protein
MAQAYIVKDGEEGLIAGAGEGGSGISGCSVAAATVFLAMVELASPELASLPYVHRIDTMLVRWFPQRAAVGKLLFHKR